MFQFMNRNRTGIVISQRPLAGALYVALPSALCVLLGACATGQTDSFRSATGESFSSRTSPAKVLPAGTKVDETKLLKLGELAADVPLKECFNRSCETIQKTGNSTEKLARDAAAKGAPHIKRISPYGKRSWSC